MSTRGFVGYRHKGEVKGWYNHSDSYPDYLGMIILRNIYCNYTWKEIKDFFLNKLTLLKRTKDNGKKLTESQDIIEADWRTITTLDAEDGWDFYKDGLYCEYSYIFDLDKPRKTLLLFKGFGEHPYKNYEDWFYVGTEENFYVKPCGRLQGTISLTIAEGEMNLRIGSFDEEDDEAPILRATTRKALRLPLKEIPALMGINDNINKIIEHRLRVQK